MATNHQKFLRAGGVPAGAAEAGVKNEWTHSLENSRELPLL
jgi:hypothetical protein